MTSVHAPSKFVFRGNRQGHLTRRALDVFLVLLTLPIFGPILILSAIAILIEDGPPVFFLQKRVGRFERLFTIIKLRTMKASLSGDALKPQSSSDHRITKVGRLLRKTSIDEIPQLFNVLKGEMTLVGPRPEMPFVVENYENWQHLRHLVTPGLTCIWQTTCRSTISLERPEATLLDLDYISSRSVQLDLRLLLNTITSIASTRGAH